MTNENVTSSSGNVFADLGLKNPEELKTKAYIVSLISKVIRENSWTQSEAAEILELKQPDVSNLIKGKLERFSLDRLFGFLAKLGLSTHLIISDQHNVVSEIPVRNTSVSCLSNIDIPSQLNKLLDDGSEIETIEAQDIQHLAFTPILRQQNYFWLTKKSEITVQGVSSISENLKIVEVV